MVCTCIMYLADYTIDSSFLFIVCIHFYIMLYTVKIPMLCTFHLFNSDNNPFGCDQYLMLYTCIGGRAYFFLFVSSNPIVDKRP